MAAGLGGIAAAILGGGLGDIVKPIAEVVGKFIPDASKAAEFTYELQTKLADRDAARDKAWADLMAAQAATNQVEATNPSLFVSGWRPFIGWICGWGCAYGFIIQPALSWLMGILGVMLAVNLPAPPDLDMAQLLGLLGGLLGIGGMRTYEKIKGVPDTNISLLKKR
jgi:hypothetical protein